MDFACVASALTDMGYLDGYGKPTDRFYRVMAENEAGELAEGFLEVYGDRVELDFIRDLMDALCDCEFTGALRILLTFAYDRSGTAQPEFYQLLSDDARIVPFCRALHCELDKLLDER